MGKHITYVPDCPECGQELQQLAESNRGLVASRYWACRNCGWKSRPADTWADFEALTDELTDNLRKEDE